MRIWRVEPALSLEGLGDLLESALNAQRGVHRPAWTIFVHERCAEQGHYSVTRILVDGALKAMHLGCNALEAAIDHVVHHLRVELLGECGKAYHIGK
jgi:hypothetical protein